MLMLRFYENVWIGGPLVQSLWLCRLIADYEHMNVYSECVLEKNSFLRVYLFFFPSGKLMMRKWTRTKIFVKV